PVTEQRADQWQRGPAAHKLTSERVPQIMDAQPRDAGGFAKLLPRQPKIDAMVVTATTGKNVFAVGLPRHAIGEQLSRRRGKRDLVVLVLLDADRQLRPHAGGEVDVGPLHG